ncbi:beta-ketoacyl synthase N-terminal-like domain-containing protein [Micromonospora sp. NPDC005220]|uniref:beta-ketoacyl synthase N-terminal-like domain-containing protein n=1 Tax=Micromonospora sp. NPDC005220 TaxID=3155589 RepID=UPI0033ADCEFD
MTAVTGYSLVLPGAPAPADLFSAGYGRETDREPVDPAARLGRKGLRYKDRATQLALCAAQDALADAGLLAGGELTAAASDVAVVVSSNLGNVDTVCRVAGTIAAESARAVSAMDTANASSNIVASEVAIRFGLRGPNVMLCNGATSGLDAIGWGVRMLRAGRARHVLVVGVEPANDVARRLARADRVVDGGAALVLEMPETASARSARAKLHVRRYLRTGSVPECLDRLGATAGQASELVLGPEGPDGAGEAAHDLSRTLGRCSGALGVLQAVAAIGWFSTITDASAPVLGVCGGGTDDASAGVVLVRPAEASR